MDNVVGDLAVKVPLALSGVIMEEIVVERYF